MLNRMTIVAAIATFLVTSAAANAQPAVDRQQDRHEKENRDAARIFKEALDAQAAWRNFPGLHAEVIVKSEGRCRMGRVIVEPDGRIHIEHLDPLAAEFVRTHLSDLVCQLLRKRTQPIQVVSLVKTDSHPLLGKSELAVSTGFDAKCWVRDKKIQLTEQTHKDRKLIVQVAEHEKNQDGAFLPAIKIASEWRADKIDETKTVLVAWNRVGQFDMPREIRIIAISGKSRGAVVSTISISSVALEERPPLSVVSKKE